MIQKPTCSQSAHTNCINLILANKKEFFENFVLQVGISNHHSFIVTALKSQLIKGNTKIKFYRDYSSFQMEDFKAELRSESQK